MANYTVTNNNDDGVGSLRWAIAQANSNGGLDTIDFEVNSVVLTTGINITDSLNVSGNGVTITQTGSDRIFNINDNTADLIEVNFDNLTLTGGNPVDTGGAISASENVSISNSQLLGNETSKRGGAIYLEGGALFTANTTISDNKIQVNDVGPSNGGAIYIRNGVLDLVDSTISANEAYAESISLAFSTGTISNTQINNNLSSGIGAFESQVTITDSTLQGNVSGISGGGMFLKENSKATIIDSNIIDNVANFGGGLGIYEDSQATISKTTISNNSASNNGGGIDTSSNSTVDVVNGTISNNNAADIGADVSSFNSVVTLTDVNLGDEAVNYEGETIEVVYTKPNLDLVTVDRFYQYERGFHFYTADRHESQSVRTQSETGTLQYRYENTAYSALAKDTDALTGELIEGAKPVYRFFNRTTGAHLYTMDENENRHIQDNLANYDFEGTAYYAFAGEQQELDTIPVYRMLNSETGTHLFSADLNEINYIQDNLSNFSAEGNNGVAFYVFEQEAVSF